MFRFTIRELVLLTLVVAMGVGWWIDSRSSREAQTALSRQVYAVNAKVDDLKALAPKVQQLELLMQLKSAELEKVRLQLGERNIDVVETPSPQP